MSEMPLFVARPETHKSLVLCYLTFPEITEVFSNISRNEALDKGIVSSWDKETLLGHIEQFMLPALEESGAIQRHQTSQSGYQTKYFNISFQGLSRSQLANVAARRAQMIANSVEDSDTTDEVLSANLEIYSMPEGLCNEIIEGIRTALKKPLEKIPDNFSNGRRFRLALVARAVKREQLQ